MDGADSKTSEFERRGSRRPSVRVSVHGEQQDDLYVQTIGVSDGFRPNLPDMTPSLGNSSRSSLATDDSVLNPPTPSHRQQASSVGNSPLPLPAPITRPSSIAKLPGPDPNDPFALRHDGGMGMRMAPSSMNTPPIDQPVPQRSGPPAAVLLSRQSTMSTATDATTPMRHESPYQGPSGPSHPYQMYPQGVTRTMSVATASTSEPAATSADQPYSGPRGPQHPYAMYAQNPVPESGAGTATSSAAAGGVLVGPVTVGFPGLAGDAYQRRLGPDGEEIADLIGPDGHTEQLPPYTRYPDEQYARKVRDAETGQASSSSPTSVESAGPATITLGAIVTERGAGAGSAGAGSGSPTTMRPIEGAGGMGLAARNPEFDSMSDLHSPRSRHSARSFASDMSHHEINTAAAGIVSEKEQRGTERWQRAGRRRLWGIVPCWAIALTVAAVLVMSVILGSVVGTFVTKQHKKPPPRDGSPEAQSASTYDATPIPVPSDLPDIPLGSFGMPMMAQRSPNLCFSDPTQSQAWTCNVVFGFAAAMTMTISRNTGSGSIDKPYSVTMSANDSLSIENSVYGYGTQAPLFKGSHELQMVNDTLEPSRGPAWFKLMPFNKTVVLHETVLSPTPTSSAARHRRGYGGSSPSPPYPGPSDFRVRMSAKPGDKPWVCTWADTLLELFIYPNQNTSFYKITSDRLSTAANPALSAATRTSSPGQTTASGALAAKTSSSSSAAPTPSNTPPENEYTPPPPPYPRVVKLEERRVRDSPPTVCRQMWIQADGSAKPNLDENGKPIQITLGEIEQQQRRKEKRAVAQDDFSHPSYSSDLFPRDGLDYSDCGCLWFMT